MILAWQEELKGGVLAICSVAAFYLVYGMALTGFNTQEWWLALFAVPGILFFAYGLLSRRTVQLFWNP